MKYKLVERNNPSQPSVPKKYYANPVNSGKVTFRNGKASNDWYSGKDANDNISDLTGYAIYSASVWSSAYSNYKNGTWELYDKDGRTAPEPLMFLPSAGMRSYDDGRVYYTGESGMYWSSTVEGDGNQAMQTLYLYVFASGLDYRADGLSVRCLSEY